MHHPIAGAGYLTVISTVDFTRLILVQKSENISNQNVMLTKCVLKHIVYSTQVKVPYFSYFGVLFDNKQLLFILDIRLFTYNADSNHLK